MGDALELLIETVKFVALLAIVYLLWRVVGLLEAIAT